MVGIVIGEDDGEGEEEENDKGGSGTISVGLALTSSPVSPSRTEVELWLPVSRGNDESPIFLLLRS